jgi:tetratricopeptide (TPR) repeat protein
MPEVSTQGREKPYKYRAFISYSHQDSATVNWLHGSLETYRLPRRLIGTDTQKGKIPERLNPVFKDREEFASSAQLSDAIQQALVESAALIVVCSPHAAESNWVNQEILEFRRLGRGNDIYCVIAAGTPGSITGEECFPPALRDDDVEPLAADLRPGGDGRRGALLKIVAGVLGLRFDDLRRRDHRRQQQRMMLITGLAVALTVVMSFLSVSAYIAQQEAEVARNQAEELIGFMLGELRAKLEPIGRLDVLDSVAQESMDYYSTVSRQGMSDDALTKRSLALRQIGEVRLFQGQLEEAVLAFSESMQLARPLVDKEPNNTARHFELGQVQFWTGYLYWERQEYRLAEKYLTDYLATSERLIQIDSTDPKWRTERAYALVNLGSLFSRQYLHEKARENFRMAVSELERLTAEDPENREFKAELANGYSWLAGEELEFGQIQVAITLFQQHLELLRQLRTDDSDKMLGARIAEGTQFLADLYLSTARMPEAKSAIDLSKTLFAELTRRDPGNVRWQGGYAVSYLLESRYYSAQNNRLDAVHSIREASSILDAVNQVSDVPQYKKRDWAIINNDYAQLLFSGGSVPEAESIVREIIQLLADEEPFEAARAHFLAGLVHEQKGEPLLAAQSWQAADDILTGLLAASSKLDYIALLAEVVRRKGEAARTRDLVARLEKSEYKNNAMAVLR